MKELKLCQRASEGPIEEGNTGDEGRDDSRGHKGRLLLSTGVTRSRSSLTAFPM